MQERGHTRPTIAEGKTDSVSLDTQLTPGIADRSLADLMWHIRRVLLRTNSLMCDGIIIPVVEHCIGSRDRGDGGGEGNAHMYEGTQKCGHQERSRERTDV